MIFYQYLLLCVLKNGFLPTKFNETQQFQTKNKILTGLAKTVTTERFTILRNKKDVIKNCSITQRQFSVGQLVS